MNRFAVPNATMGLPGKPVNGGSGPRFYDFDDGVARLVKWYPSHQGAKMCFNELIASRLGQLIGAPILRGAVVYVPEETIPPSHLPEAKAGFQFGVTRMEGDNFRPSEHYAEIENRAELGSAAVLLAWLDVEDHLHHNQYLQRLEVKLTGTKPKVSKLFRLIDMGYAFCDGDWNAATVAGLSDAYTLPPHMEEKLTFSDVDAAIANLQRISDADIRRCLDDVPEDWGIASEDIQAVAKRLCETRDCIETIIRKGNPFLWPST